MWSRPRPRKPTHATRTVSLALASALERSAAPAEIAEPKKYRRSMPDSVVLFRAYRVIAASNCCRSIRFLFAGRRPGRIPDRLREHDFLFRPQAQRLGQFIAVHHGPDHGREAFRSAEQVHVLSDRAGFRG